ncbi:translocation/assembly module TamB domain-containing protein [Flavisolibacter nicotianae]|uniref:translocation/assembly module TamB domain-containing protein n=1 Tax=Flavisolibacter nicotianae TaxID=2364882 RepID=UPI000EB42BD0|nr:translocation/assembly module TamB [Flavisolibacter nicotianae]
MQEETKTELRKPSWPRRVGRIFLKSLLFLFLFIILVFLLLLTPPAQRFLTGRVENYLGKKLQTRVSIGRIGFGLSGNILLQNVYIEDRTKDTLVSGGAIKAHLNFLKLFSNEVEVKDIELQNIVAKVKRVLPDTAFNYQFVVDAFTSEQTKKPDTAQTAPMKLNVSDVTLDNVVLSYRDAITGVDMFSRIGYATTTIDTLDPYTQTFDFPSLIVRNTTVKMKQVKPLLEPKPLAVDIKEAQTPTPMKLNFDVIDLTKVSVQYDNDVSALYSTLSIGKAKVDGKLLDLQKNRIYLDELSLANTVAAIRLGKSPGAEVVKQQAKQEAVAQTTVPWDLRVDKMQFDNADIRYDDDNQPRLAYGMDYSHLKADDVVLHADNVFVKPDSTGLTLVKASFKEKSGFVLNEARGELFYGASQAYLKDLFIKSPGSEIKRNAALHYASLAELQKHFERAVIDLDIENSYVQVKDILTFAPQLRSQPALRNPNAVWRMNLEGHGTMDRLNIAKLQFDGLQNTHLNASGTLLGLANPANAGGNFTIYRFHTTQSDIALFAGNSLKQAGLDLPQSFDLSGMVNGNAGRLNTRLNLNTTDGDIDLNGSFANLMNPSSLSYNATARASGLQLGKILKQQGQIGSLTGTFTANGRGITPGSINTTFKAAINHVGYNHYAYRNIRLNGSLQKTFFKVNADVADPNADMTLTASGDYAAYGPFKINADIDSVKAQNLGFSTEPLTFHGKINGTASGLNSDSPAADVLLTQALVVSGTNRLPLDSLQIIAGRDNENFITLRSDIASAELRGQYRLMDLGNIIQSNLSPYFTAAGATTRLPAVAPYDIRFRADLYFSPALQGFVPDLKEADNVHAEGSLATGQGLNALLTAPKIVYQTNVVNNLQARIHTNDSGLHVNATMDRLKAAGLDVYATRLNATALHNNINFSVGIDDRNKRNKYILGGLVSLAPDGNMTLHLNPDSLLLNYDRWTVSPNNSIVVGKGVTANDFTLSQAGQQLRIQSLGTAPSSPLEVRFTNFRIGTLTAFLKPDTTLVDGVMNGTATFTNLTQQPLFTSNLTVTDLMFRQDTVGNLNAQVSSTGTRYNANVTLTGKGNDLAITGYMEPSGNEIAMNLDLAIRQFQLNTFEGALKDFITSANGAVNGSVSLRGTTAAPKVDGRINFDNVSVVTQAIGGPFNVDKESLVVVSNKGLEFNRFSIRDSANNALTINGLVGTTNFVNYDFDLDIRARHFRAVNTTKKQNSIYYGKLYLTSNVHVGGTESAPVVDGNLTVDDETDFTVVVPQRDPGIVSREGVVQFVDFSNPGIDSLFLATYDSLNRSVLTGYDITTNIEVKKEAKFSIVIDEANGDFVNLQGEALLSAGIDPSGKINLTGSYEIEQGSYQLSYNFIQRKFDIQKGSRIEWLGEPTAAQLNVKAVYVANTAPLDLVSNYISASSTAIRNTYLQKLPFQVWLNLQGQLMQPQISFDIILPTDKNYGVSSDIITNVDTRLTQLRQEPSELNKQVFSLLLLGRFVGENPFQSSGGGFSASAYAMQSASKLLTEQLNNLTQDLISGVDLNFDVTSSDDYTTGSRRQRTDLNVGLSKSLLNNRLSVTVGSNFELQGPQQQSAQGGNNIAGNIAVNYQLSRDGRYMLRAYRRNEYFGVVDGYVVETGLRFIITLDYDRFIDILRRRKLRVENKEKQNQPDQ